ncbi:C1 protein [Vernonia yellow vein Fujian betasatellite]|uniref:C1 protein n=1 Tax=Vernonia yellow vein Fujian betasatellite TaxID=2050589 RepID=G1C5E5_9VIRU|nr:C1 protein [Vernonia yellow vein Fujian betasatellite]AEL22995.1 C1 protein [Vernonia yellow vein Fujian betasatellite]
MNNKSSNHQSKQMTITHTTNKGIRFVFSLQKKQEHFLVTVKVINTSSPVLSKHTYKIRYDYQWNAVPFDFNGLETSMKNTIEVLYHDSSYNDFKEENMIDAIDTIMFDTNMILGVEIIEPHTCTTSRII